MSNPQNNEEHSLGYKETIKIAWWSIRLMYKLNPFYSSLYVIAEIFNSLKQLGNTYLFTLVIDEAVKLSQSTSKNTTYLLYLIGALFIYNTISSLLSTLRSISTGNINLTTYIHLKRALNEKLNSLGIEALELPEINNKMTRAETGMENIPWFYRYAIGAISMTFMVISSGLILVKSYPILVLLMACTLIPKFFVDKFYRLKEWKTIFESTEERRRANASGSNLNSVGKLNEIFVSSAYSFLDSRFYNVVIRIANQRLSTIKSWYVSLDASDVFNNLVTYTGYFLTLSEVIVQKMSIGQGMFLMRTMDSFNDYISYTTNQINEMTSAALRVRDFYYIIEMQKPFQDGTIKVGKLAQGPEIKIQNLNFSYPNSKKKVIEDLNLTVKSGEKLAIVGHNGAGKTTLVKLINRLYRATDEAISINGTNINDLAIQDYYQNVGILFQEFNTYPQLTAKENIIIGDPEKPVNEDEVIEAAKNADAYSFIMDYPYKFDQVLSESYKEGIRPSTGQWQKIAIARFFYRNAPLVIFDEPTAAIDAISEYNIFNKIYEFFKGKTVIIISHRFSTVRNADRIVVLEHGKIIEEGTHNELIEKDGYYAKSFKLQAEGYNN